MITNMNDLLNGTTNRINNIRDTDVSDLSVDDRELAHFILMQKLHNVHDSYDLCDNNTENMIELHDTVMHLMSMISVFKSE